MYLKTFSRTALCSERNQMLLERYRAEGTKDHFSAVKCPDIAKQLRQFGTEFAEHEFYLNAIELLNRSLCFAPPNSAMLGYLYSSRANVFFAMELYAESLDSLALALANNYPCELRHRLESKAELCRKKLEEKGCGHQELNVQIKLSYCANPKLPAIIRGIHLEENCEFGRHLITDMDLKVGDVICIESSFLKVLEPGQRFMRCTHCQEEVPHRLFPCDRCTNAMFCSATCEKAAWRSYHEDECSMSDELIAQVMDIHRMALRIFFKTLNLFDKDLAQFTKFLLKNKCRKITAYDLDYQNFCEKDEFLAYFSGHAQDDHFPCSWRENNLNKAIIMASLIGEYTDYSDQMRCDKTKVFVIETLYHFICVNANNCYEIGSPSSWKNPAPNCLAIFLAMSMSTHSCAGNVMRLRYGLKQMWVVTRPIMAGSQILDNYGSSFLTMPREQRQCRSKLHYGFECRCEACEYDYPTLEGLPQPQNVPFPGKSFLDSPGPMNLEKAKAELIVLRRYMTKYDAYFPCHQLRIAEWRLVDLFRTMAKDEDLESKFPEYFSTKSVEELWEEDKQEACEKKCE